MVKRPADFNAFEFVVMSAQRAAQLTRGCIPLIHSDALKKVTTAQMEVATYKIIRSTEVPPVAVPVEEPLVVAAVAE
jgi:DNA-directed RNA polymerase subunit K/omega